MFVIPSRHTIDIQLNWTIKVKVPLIGGMLEKHAHEVEIRQHCQGQHIAKSRQIRRGTLVKR